MKKILITGIKGFLGSNLAYSLRNHKLFGLGRKEEFFEDIQVFSSNELEKLDPNIDIIIMCHAAVASGNTLLSNDVLYEINVCLTEKIVAKFPQAFIIYLSTASIYKITPLFIREQSNIYPQSNYALSKLWAERIVLLHKKASVLRISSMFGISMKENTLIPNYVNQALSNKEILVWGNGARLQNYIHVDDVIRYITLMIDAQKKVIGQIILGVSTKEYSNLEIAQIISDITNAKIKFVNEDNSSSVKYNNEFSTTLLNWKQEINIEKRLQKYIEWKQKKC
ncbi:NAD-dependent epimerase/dehydratase family protein [Flavobacterium sp. 1355]|uniref:NAD-dependent epimerase/dehydratase family protein n=1 Tax=Flavobacterium sp. 1355 TaxID=2806571 RepID=UPI001AE97635|nr:NAD(P)-dependent oxidoreductase [Flavobacterium sp. 1355]MBP1224042.1 UDP-glucose 4-epimerase [Flavobacterium sp. 1355]